jgi:hypothetical protein
MIETRRTVQGDRELLCAPLQDVEIRQSGDPAHKDYYTLTGHAAVFGDTADLGSFRETIEPGSFRSAIETSTVHLLWNHNTDLPLASTDSGTLDLREDATGLRVWARVPKALSYASDLRTLMDTGIATGMSFAFTLPADGSGEVWTRSDDGTPERTITQVEALYDVSATPRGAYSSPQYAMRSVYDNALTSGRLSDERGTDQNPVAQPEAAGEARTADELTEPDGMRAERAGKLAALQADADRRRRISAARNR